MIFMAFFVSKSGWYAIGYASRYCF